MQNELRQKIRIGIPRALLYHKYHVFWEELLKNLGYDIVLSPLTNKEILNNGVNNSIDESCLALKVYMGHVDALLDKCDYLFIPRIVSLYKKENICVKFHALGDVARNTFPDAKIIEYTIDINNNIFEYLSLLNTFVKMGKNPLKITSSYLKAKNKYKNSKNKALEKQHEMILKKDRSKPTVLIVSHPYTTYDHMFGTHIVRLLEKMGVSIIYADIVDEKTAREKSLILSKDLYWSYNKELIGAIELYKNNVDGIVFMLSFPCGPDSLVVNLCQHKIQGIPMLVLSLDELQGEAGLKTRLESFIDILDLRTRQKKLK